MLSNLIKNKFIIFSPVIWLIYFGVLFSLYFECLGISGIDEFYLSDHIAAKEFMWRIVWGLFSIMTVLISTLSLLCSLGIVFFTASYYYPKYIDRIFSVSLIFLLIVIGLFLNFSLGDKAVSSLLLNAQNMVNIHVVKIVDRTMILATCAAAFIAISNSLMLMSSRLTGMDRLKEEYFYFRVSFYITSIFLGVGIAQVSFLFIWACHASEGGMATLQMVKALTISGSLIYTLVFIILFVPVSVALKSKTRKLAKEVGVENDGFKEWKISNGLFNTPSKNFSDVVVLLSPMVLAGIGNIISQFPK